MMFPRQPFWTRLAVVLLLVDPMIVQADVHMPGIFGDHMVLQQKSKLPVWGWAAPGEKVVVTFKDQQRTTVAAADGAWRVELGPVDPSSQAATLSVIGRNRLVFTDVVVGDVWVASGQSNMEFGIQTDSRGKEAIATATDPQIRFFFVPWATALEPQTDIGPAAPPSPLNGKWLVCSPEIMNANWAWHGFSAVGYYFAKEIRRTTGQPVGMIGTYKGSTAAQAWTSIAGLKKDEPLAHYVAQYQRVADSLADAQTRYAKQRDDYESDMTKWRAQAERAKAAGQVSPAAPAPKAPTPPSGGYGTPASCFQRDGRPARSLRPQRRHLVSG